MELAYGVKDRPKFGKLLVFALQQLLAIMSATILVPMLVGNGMSTAAALFGAGVGTIVYLALTKFKSPVFLGSSFAFIGSMSASFAGAASMSLGYLGLLIGALFAGIVYVILAVLVKFVGTKWIDKIMPAVVIGPTVAIIGLSLSGSAIGNLSSGAVSSTSPYVAIICGLATLIVTIVCSVYGKKTLKMIPFIIGISAGYVLAAIFTALSYIPVSSDAPIAELLESLRVIDFSLFTKMQWYPDFTFLTAFSGNYNVGTGTEAAKTVGAFIGTVAVAYIPVAFVVFAEHIADHKNISSIIGQDLLKDPGLHRTLLGDGVGSIAGAFFGGCPNTTYGESVGCVAISGNASVVTIFATACMAIVISFIAPFITLLSTIPPCVMGGVCIALYGFIAVSGLKMIQKVDLSDNRNLFVVSSILIPGVGGMVVSFGKVTITEVACALILGIIVNLIVGINRDKKSEEKPVAETAGADVFADTTAEAAATEEITSAPEQEEEKPVEEKPAEEEHTEESSADEPTEEKPEEEQSEEKPQDDNPAEEQSKPKKSSSKSSTSESSSGKTTAKKSTTAKSSSGKSSTSKSSSTKKSTAKKAAGEAKESPDAPKKSKMRSK